MDRQWIKLNLKYCTIELGSKAELLGKTTTQIKISDHDDDDDIFYIELIDSDLDRLIDALVRLRYVNKKKIKIIW